MYNLSSLHKLNNIKHSRNYCNTAIIYENNQYILSTLEILIKLNVVVYFQNLKNMHVFYIFQSMGFFDNYLYHEFPLYKTTSLFLSTLSIIMILCIPPYNPFWDSPLIKAGTK